MQQTKAKNAQEAHEAIRPTDPTQTPAKVAHLLDPSQLNLYTLIWQRTLACQMTSALMDQARTIVFSFRIICSLGHIYPSATYYGLFKGQRAMMVGDPCPMHKHFHTILGLQARTLFCPAYTMAG